MDAAQYWDDVYAKAKYAGEPPLPFTGRIVETLNRTGLIKSKGLYVGCGNGRNYLPLLELGLDLVGLDISRVALDQILDKNPKAELLHGDFLEIDDATKYGYIIAIQVFQHGNAQRVAEYFRMCAKLLNPDGLLFLRVRSVNTGIDEAHEVIEKLDDGSFSILYKGGAKKGLVAHYFSEGELGSLTSFGLDRAGEVEEVIEDPEPPRLGKKIHLEGVWRKL